MIAMSICRTYIKIILRLISLQEDSWNACLYYLNSFTVGKWFVVMVDLANGIVNEQFGQNPENDLWL